MMVQTGMSDLVVAGGVESMSNVEHYTTELRKGVRAGNMTRSEEHTSELQSLMRISYAVFCLKKKNTTIKKKHKTNNNDKTSIYSTAAQKPIEQHIHN